MTTCNARGCDEEAWEPAPPFPPRSRYPFDLCLAHWNTDHQIVVETVSGEGFKELHSWGPRG